MTLSDLNKKLSRYIERLSHWENELIFFEFFSPVISFEPTRRNTISQAHLVVSRLQPRPGAQPVASFYQRVTKSANTK